MTARVDPARRALVLGAAALCVAGRASAAPAWAALPFRVPGRDFPVGLRGAVTDLKDPARDALPDGCRYDAGSRRLILTRAGVTLAGWDCRDLTNVLVAASGCVIRDCLFGSRQGYFGITTAAPVQELSIEWCTLDGERRASDHQGLLQAGDARVSLRNCRIFGTPGDCLQISRGMVEHCHLAAGGFNSAQHADIVFVPFTSGEGVTIRENLLDATDGGTIAGPQGSRRGINNCIQAGAISARPDRPQPSIHALAISRNIVIGHPVAFAMSFGKAKWTAPTDDRRVVVGCSVVENYIYPHRRDGLVVHPQASPPDLIWRDNRHLLTGAAIPAPRKRG